MKTVDNYLTAIESNEFAATINVASNLKTFVRGVRLHPQSSALLQAALDTKVQESIYQRLIDLATARIDDDGLENPYDTALASYLWILDSHHSPRAVAAARIVKRCPQCWWAHKVADEVSAKTANQSSAS